MRIPTGRLLRSRVVSDVGVSLRVALERELTGYARLEPQNTLLLGEEITGVITFENGVPVLAYSTDSDRGGADALADLAVPGPYRVELYELDPTDLAQAHEATELQVPPDIPAERLAGDPDLAARTRERAPTDRLDGQAGASAVESFLADAEKIEAIREQAREEAQRRAQEWGLGGVLDSPAGDDVSAMGDDVDSTSDDAIDPASEDAVDSTDDGGGPSSPSPTNSP
ncbi:MAG: hypothetical protein ACQETI_04080 [Halobacteriota archaeon]